MLILSFPQAVNVHRSDPEVLQRALEARAVAHEQIRDYKAAQDDCRSLIAQFPTAPKGYLRLGKIYRLQKQPEQALRIYAVGMRRAGHDDLFLRQIEATQQQLAKRQLSPETAPTIIVDPLAALPTEVLHRVWSRLGEADRLEAGRMSRAGARYRWRASPHRCHLYLSSSPATSTVIGQAIQSHLAIPGRKIQAITCTSPSACQALFKLLARTRLPSLHKLTLRGIDLAALFLAGPSAAVTRLFHHQLTTLALEGCLLDGPTYALLGHSESLQRLHLWQCRLSSALPSLPADLPLLHRPSVTILHDLAGPPGASSWYRMGGGGAAADCPLALETAQGGYHVGRRAVAIGAGDIPWMHLLSQGDMAIRHLVLFPPPAALDAVRLEGWLRGMPSRHLCSLHILTPCLSVAQLGRILTEGHFPSLREISLHALSDGVVEPVRLLGILQAPPVRLVCLPILAGLAPDRQRAIRAASRRPEQCRIIFDPEQSLRIARRHWRLAPWAR